MAVAAAAPVVVAIIKDGREVLVEGLRCMEGVVAHIVVMVVGYGTGTLGVLRPPQRYLVAGQVTLVEADHLCTTQAVCSTGFQPVGVAVLEVRGITITDHVTHPIPVRTVEPVV
jgi:hypothetical protein